MTMQPGLLPAQPALTSCAASDAVLADVLRWLRIGGALFLHAEFTAPWAYDSPPGEQLAQALKPGARRLILFHLVPEGECLLSLRDGDCARLSAGDVVMLPYADQHRVGSGPDVSSVPVDTLLPAQPWRSMPLIRYGGGGPRTQLFCGYLHSEELPFDPVLAALPRLMHLRSAGTPLASWVEASVRYALDAERLRPADDPLLQRLPELLFAECLRLCLRAGENGQSGAQAELDGHANPAGQTGQAAQAAQATQGDGERPDWFAALADPVVGRALRLIHADHARDWTLDSLAREAASSRSRLDERFRRRLGCAPMQYLARWRLQVAGHLLRSTLRSVADIAEAVGYGSEASLSRAFKRHAGVPPSAWREG